MTIPGKADAKVFADLRAVNARIPKSKWRVFASNGIIEIIDADGGAVIHWQGFDSSALPQCRRRSVAESIVTLHNGAFALLNAAEESTRAREEIDRLRAELAAANAAKKLAESITRGMLLDEQCTPTKDVVVQAERTARKQAEQRLRDYLTAERKAREGGRGMTTDTPRTKAEIDEQVHYMLVDVNGNDRYPPYPCNFVTQLADQLAVVERKAKEEAESVLASLADTVAAAHRNTGMPNPDIRHDTDLREFVWKLSYEANAQRQRAEAAEQGESLPPAAPNTGKVTIDPPKKEEHKVAADWFDLQARRRHDFCEVNSTSSGILEVLEELVMFVRAAEALRALSACQAELAAEREAREDDAAVHTGMLRAARQRAEAAEQEAARLRKLLDEACSALDALVGAANLGVYDEIIGRIRAIDAAKGEGNG